MKFFWRVRWVYAVLWSSIVSSGCPFPQVWSELGNRIVHFGGLVKNYPQFSFERRMWVSVIVYEGGISLVCANLVSSRNSWDFSTTFSQQMKRMLVLVSAMRSSAPSHSRSLLFYSNNRCQTPEVFLKIINRMRFRFRESAKLPDTQIGLPNVNDYKFRLVASKRSFAECNQLITPVAQKPSRSIVTSKAV